MESPFLTPLVEYGFVGMTAVLLGILVRVISKFFVLSKEVISVIERNTNIISTLNSELHEVRDSIRHHGNEVEVKSKEIRTAIYALRDRIILGRRGMRDDDGDEVSD